MLGYVSPLIEIIDEIFLFFSFFFEVGKGDRIRYFCGNCRGDGGADERMRVVLHRGHTQEMNEDRGRRSS